MSTFGFNTLSVLPVLSKQMPSSTQSSVEKSLLIWSLWQLPSFSAPLCSCISMRSQEHRGYEQMRHTVPLTLHPTPSSLLMRFFMGNGSDPLPASALLLGVQREVVCSLQRTDRRCADGDPPSISAIMRKSVRLPEISTTLSDAANGNFSLRTVAMRVSPSVREHSHLRTGPVTTT
ncbi:hypothetical protein EYF80_002318 [Liparis tanakae]|uniref:Uncharacterized protein n=1 Tax=Liparis tanakae TaxID=230148 RepID=A0A4Z2JC59_9TELE|nr:hypothetical protein EYF80_002318 [Liparis tanakae]